MKCFVFLFCFLSSFSLSAAIGAGTLRTLSTTAPNGNTLPQVSVDPVGNALSVWYSIFTNQIFASRFNVTTGNWSTAVVIGTGNSPQVGVDKNGNGIALWISTTNLVQAARFNVTSLTWSTPVTLTTTGLSSFPVLAVNLLGNAAALWSLFPNQLQGSTFNASTGTWATPVIVNANAGLQELGIDQSGSAIAVWLNLSTNAIQAYRFAVP